MSGAWESAFGDGRSDYQNNTQPMSEEERKLLALTEQLAGQQIGNIESMQPYQRELFMQAIGELRRQGATSAALDQLITPSDEAKFAQEDFMRGRQAGDIQSQLAQQNASQILGGGVANPQQLAQIKAAADSAIASGSADIDVGIQRGIGLVSDEIANARGLRMTDTPILREATLLSRSGQDQKANLVRGIRANQASAELEYPLAVSGLNLQQQDRAAASTQFQQQLRQLATQNRLSLFGTTSQSGIGLSGLGTNAATSGLGSLSSVREKNTYGSGFDPAKNLAAGGQYLSGAGNLMGGIFGGKGVGSDRRLKTDIERVGTLPSGIPVYTFKYLGTEDVHTGVMADEVLKVIPEAVSKDEDGYLLVRYDMLSTGTHPRAQ